MLPSSDDHIKMFRKPSPANCTYVTKVRIGAAGGSFSVSGNEREPARRNVSISISAVTVTHFSIQVALFTACLVQLE